MGNVLQLPGSMLYTPGHNLDNDESFSKASDVDNSEDQFKGPNIKWRGIQDQIMGFLSNDLIQSVASIQTEVKKIISKSSNPLLLKWCSRANAGWSSLVYKLSKILFIKKNVLNNCDIGNG